ncbi:MAG: hypothetical protein OEY48_05905 [Gammaproteobacteria bacterium]|nr:hypothetical protein [Gammaproteobacteria bacterium]MDH5592367.1 hypothetical protein [Gammaproteobacteria bacterium]
MKKLIALTLFGSVLSMSINASESPVELLAGVEAGIDAGTVMTISDLNRTQDILSSQPTGALNTWYNIDTTTHYELKIGQHYSQDLRPCISYDLTVKHNSVTEEKELNSCMNYEGHWIAQLDMDSMN